MLHSAARRRRSDFRVGKTQREEYVDENMGRIISIAEDRLLSSQEGYVRIDAGEL